MKPLGRKAYGSIGHLPGSRLGPADHHVHDGQAAICLTGRDSKGRTREVFVQTKLDGSCCAAARLDDGTLVALGRAGYLADSSPYAQHHLFADWVRDNAGRFSFLEPGERCVGEWLALAHGTIYNLDGLPPFVAFDIMRGSDRVPLCEFLDRVGPGLSAPDTIDGPATPEEAMGRLWDYGAEGGHEGVVYRVERNGRVEFLAKFVRSDKVDGLYLDTERWNWRPEETS
jgi:hypothetical protein